MPAATAPVDAEAFRPPVRLRTILAVLVLAAVGFWVHPRATAAWQLHHLANSYADYAACMVGPTGPTLLRDNPSEFARLIERRLVGARPTDAPFRACAKLAERSGADHETLRAHELTAESFVEYGGIAADVAANGGAAPSSSRLALKTETLARLASGAWPFVRSGYTRLVKPSSHAKEAVHPVAPPSPGVGSGLPAGRTGSRAAALRGKTWIAAFGTGANLTAYASTDKGVTWQVTRASEASEFADGCPVDEHGRAFSFSVDGATGRTVVVSLGPETAPYAAELAEGDERILAATCDSRALVVALQKEAQTATPVPPAAHLRLCPYRKPCRDMALPEWGQRGLRQPFDVARVGGTTVVAAAAHGITRVSSTRDDGRTWTPPAVAFDRHSGLEEGLEMPPPHRLLTVGERVLLYGGGRTQDEAYWLLVSDDHGASFRTP